jgi:N-dimethylarginine dimethylaminohydrolase
MDSTTHHSEAGQLLTVFIKPVEQAFISEEKIQQEWKDLNYLGAPDLPKAREEYAYFKQLLEKSGAEVLTIPSDDETTMDSMYCRDAAILTEEGAILCNMGKAEREPEPEALKKAFEKENIPILGTITSPGTLEGGDVAWVDERTLAVGHSYRTNEEGDRTTQSAAGTFGGRSGGRALAALQRPVGCVSFDVYFQPGRL